MEHVRSLSTNSYLVYANYAFINNHFWLSLLQHFEGIKTLSLMLMYLRDIENYQYMMEYLTVLPDITFLRLRIVANGHAFEASAFHILRLCTGIRRLMLQFGLEIKLFFVYLILHPDTEKRSELYAHQIAYVISSQQTGKPRNSC